MFLFNGEIDKRFHLLHNVYIIHILNQYPMNHNTRQKTNIGTARIKKIFALSAELAEVTEDILEEQGTYSDEFLAGLKKSLREARTGKLTRITSLRQLR